MDLKTEVLTQDQWSAVTECMKSVDAAPLLEESDSEVNLNGLDEVVDTFVAKFAPWTKVNNSTSISHSSPQTDF